MVIRERTKLKILAAIRQIAICEGATEVTMDKVASHLSISKKTIYTHFSSKTDILNILLRRYLQKKRALYLKKKTPLDANEKISCLFQLCDDIYCLINTQMEHFMKIHMRDAVEDFYDFESDFLIGSFSEAIYEGVQNGQFRPQINPRILGVLALETIKMAHFNSPMKANKSKYQAALIEHFVAGLLISNKIVQK